MTQENANQQYQYITRRIGSTTYKVKVVFASVGETLEEKILRMIRNKGSASTPLYGITAASRLLYLIYGRAYAHDQLYHVRFAVMV